MCLCFQVAGLSGAAPVRRAHLPAGALRPYSQLKKNSDWVSKCVCGQVGVYTHASEGVCVQESALFVITLIVCV